MAILKQLEDEYEILEKLQESGAGTIHKVRHRQLNELRMVMVRPQLRGDAGQRLRFLPEAHAASRLGHANVARVFDAVVDDDGVALVVVELINGMALAELLPSAPLSRLSPFGGTSRLSAWDPPPLALTLEIARQSLRALGHLHDHHLVHHDVSPDNLMLTRDAHGRPLVKLIDLGVARDVGAGGGSASAGVAPVFIGKLRYAAPETFDDGTSEDQRSDLYSFALVLYELLTGRFPISGESASSLIAGHLFRPPLDFAESDPQGRVSEQIRRALLKALAKSPDERFARAASFARALGRSRLSASGATGVEPDLSSPEVLKILEMAQDEDLRPGRAASGLDDAPTRILRPSPSAERREASDSWAAPTRILRPVPAATAETRRLGADQMRAMQADELTARAHDRAQAEDLAQARDLLHKALALEPDHRRAAALLAAVGAGGEAPGQEVPSAVAAGATPAATGATPAATGAMPALPVAEQVAAEPPTERLDDVGVLHALRTEAALAQRQAANEESTTVIRDGVEPTIGHDQATAPAAARPEGGAAPAAAALEGAPPSAPVALDETLRTIRALCDDGRAGEALERLNRAVREFGPQPTLKTLRDELGEALLERDAEEEESASQMFELEPTGDVGPALTTGETSPGGAPRRMSPSGMPPSGLPPGGARNLAEAPVRGLSDATIRSFEVPVQQVRDRPDPPTAHPTRNMMAAGLILVVVFAALVYVITRGGPAGERQPLEAEDVAAADLSPGSLVLDAVPWAEIIALENPALEAAPPISPSRFTPVILRLPPGEYRISLRYPPTGQTEELLVRVDSDVQVEERVIFEDLDAQAYFERIGW